MFFFSFAISEFHALSLCSFNHSSLARGSDASKLLTLVEALHPERSLGHSPLFQAMLVLQTATPLGGAAGGFELGGVAGEALELGSLGSKFDVTLSLAEAAGGLVGTVEYDADLFAAATVARLVAQLGSVLGQLADAPDLPVWRLALVGAAERARLAAAPAPPRARAEAGSVVALLAAQVGVRGDALAVEGGGERLSYRALWTRAGVLAARLRRQGVGADGVVGLCLPRGVAAVVAVVAVWRAGASYVALDPSYPDARLRYLIRDSGAAVVLCQGGDAAARLAALPAEDGPGDGAVALDLDALDRGGGDDADADDPALAGPAHPASLAYVIYTSGSTGQPKPVAVSHRGIVNLARQQIAGFAVAPGDRVLQFASSSFDASVVRTGDGVEFGGDAGAWRRRKRCSRDNRLRTWWLGNVISHVTLPSSALAVMTPANFALGVVA